MNFLDLCRRLRRKCRVSGSGPASLSNQSEEYNRLIDWVNEAWMDIQTSREDWAWMRGTATFPTVAGQATYTLAQIGLTDFGNWKPDTFRNYVTSVGTNSEVFMDPLPYDVWRDRYLYGALRNTRSQPIELAVTPDLGIALGPVPTSGYTILGDYFKVPSELEDATDTPGLPTQYHMAIVYRAMMFYGASESAPEVYDEGAAEFKRMMTRLELQQLPIVSMAGALA